MPQIASRAAGRIYRQPPLVEKESQGIWSSADLTDSFLLFFPYLKSMRKRCQLYLKNRPCICLPRVYDAELSRHRDTSTSTLVPLPPILHPVARLIQRECQSDLATPLLKALLQILMGPRVKPKLLCTVPRALPTQPLPPSTRLLSQPALL